LAHRDHERQYLNFKPCLPASESYQDHVVSQSVSESNVPSLLVMPRNSAGLNIYTRGLTSHALDKRIPFA
jgi:hypothetical protein